MMPWRSIRRQCYPIVGLRATVLDSPLEGIQIRRASRREQGARRTIPGSQKRLGQNRNVAPAPPAAPLNHGGWIPVSPDGRSGRPQATPTAKRPVPVRQDSRPMAISNSASFAVPSFFLPVDSIAAPLTPRSLRPIGGKSDTSDVFVVITQTIQWGYFIPSYRRP
jgi:hypothetical protein